MFGFLLLFLSFRFFLFHFIFFPFKTIKYSFFKFVVTWMFFHHWLQVHLSIIYCFNYSVQPTIVDSALAFFGWLILVLDVVCGSDLLSWKQAACFHRRMGVRPLEPTNLYNEPGKVTNISPENEQPARVPPPKRKDVDCWVTWWNQNCNLIKLLIIRSSFSHFVI